MNKEGMVIATYKYTEIRYVEKTNKFVFENEEGVKHEAASLLAAKRVIGSWNSPEEKAKAQPKQKGLKYNGTHYGKATINEVIVGAFGKARYGDLCMWLTDSRGRNRTRDRVREWNPVYKDTPEVREALAKVSALAEELETFKQATQKKTEALLKGLPTVQPAIPVEDLPHWDR